MVYQRIATTENWEAGDLSGLPPAPNTAALEPRSQMGVTAGASVSVRPGRKAARARRATSTKIGKSVLKNAAEIELIGASFIALIDSRIELLRQKRPNSGEGRAAVEREISDCEVLKRRVELFLGAASEFAAEKVKETPLVETTNSLAAGIGDWWSKRHVDICDKAFEVGLFGVGVTICLLAGAGGALAVGIPGAMVGGKPVVEVIKAFAKRPRTKPE